MLADLNITMAADPGSSPEALHYLYTQAVHENDLKTLSALAGNTNLPQALVAKFENSTSAKVIVAWLQRPGTTPEAIMAAAGDKRVTVGALVAGTPGLPEDAYRAVQKRHAKNARVNLALLKNADTPEDVTYNALKALIASTEPGRGSRSTYQLSHTMEALFSYNSKISNQLLCDNTVTIPPSLTEAFVKAPGLTPESVRSLENALLEHLLKADKDPDSRFSSYWSSNYVGTAITLCSYTDSSAEFREQVRKLTQRDPWQAKRFADAVSPAKQRMRPIVATSDEENAVVRSIVARCQNLQDRFIAVRSNELTDDQYVAALCTHARSWGQHPDGYTEAKLRNFAETEIARWGGNAKRVAAVATRLPVQYVPWRDVTAHLPAVVEQMVSIGNNADYFVAYPEDYLQVVVEAGMGDEIAQVVPLDSLSRYLRCSLGMRHDEFHRQVGRYLWQTLGDDTSAWRVLDSLMDSRQSLSVGEAVNATFDALGR